MRKIIGFVKRILWGAKAEAELARRELLPELAAGQLNYECVQRTMAALYPLPSSKVNEYEYISSGAKLGSVCAKILSKQSVLGVDLEQYKVRGLGNKTCMIQIYASHNPTFLIDTLAVPKQAVRDSLQPIFENPQVIKVFHDCRSDLSWLRRDFDDLRCINIFDTYQMAAKFKHLGPCGLAKLWSHYCDYGMPDGSKKKMQLSNWSTRPLSKEQLDYAAMDSYFLIYLRSSLIIDYFKSELPSDKENGLLRILQGMQKPSSKSSESYYLDKRIAGYLKERLGTAGRTKFLTENIFTHLYKSCIKEGNDMSFSNKHALFSIAVDLPETEGDLEKTMKKKRIKNEYVKKHAKEIVETVLKSKAEWKADPEKMRRSSHLLKKNPEKKEKVAAPVIQKPPNEDCRIMDPNGNFFCKCDKQKIDWYVRKNLGTIIHTDPLTLKLSFQPMNPSSPQEQAEEDKSCIEPRERCCVACGATNNLLNYDVVPSCYERYMPTKYKMHRGHDVLLLCERCHEVSTKKSEAVKEMLGKKYAKLADRAEEEESRKKLEKVKRLAANLVKLREKKDFRKISKTKEKALSLADDLIKKGIIKPLKHENEISDEELKEIMESKIKPIEKPSGKVIVKSPDDIAEFIGMWRKWFVENMQPKFLPKGWSVDYKAEKKFEKLGTLSRGK